MNEGANPQCTFFYTYKGKKFLNIFFGYQIPKNVNLYMNSWMENKTQ